MQTINHLLNENHNAMLADITLKEIIDSGKITNRYQVVLLVALLQILPDSFFLSFNQPCDCEQNEVALTQKVDGMSDAQHVKLATTFSDILKTQRNQGVSPLTLSTWTRLVSQKQD